MQEEYLHQIIADNLHLKLIQVRNTVEMLDNDHTVPFISRYRKERTGSLDEENIRNIQDRIRYLRNLDDRKKTILKSISDQGKLTPDLEEKIFAVMILQELEDLYLPFKPKRKTRATKAKEKGLEPLADMILAQDIHEGEIEEFALNFINKIVEFKINIEDRRQITISYS